MPEVFPSNFYSTVVNVRLLWSVSHIFTVVCSKICFFIFFNNCKMLKMLKIGCFKQNHCTSGMPQGIPMQFFAQQWWKSGYCHQFHTYSQWFAVKFVLLYFSIGGKCSKCLKEAVLSKITLFQACLKVFPSNFLAKQWWKSGYCDQFHTYSQWFAAKFVF